MKRIAGHWWTLLPDLQARLSSARAAADGAPWSCALDGDGPAPQRLHGSLSLVPGARAIVVVVHGLGGDPQSPYCRRIADAAAAHGWSCLRVGLRGTAPDATDFYHAGLSSDIAAALTAPEVARHRDVFVVGYSLGGHVTLRTALHHRGMVRAVASISAPLDLGAAADAFDNDTSWVYRAHVLGALRRMYRRIARGGPVPTPVPVIDAITTIRGWDRHTVVPRWGFFSTDDYYTRMSVGPRLRELSVPTLLVHARTDPMVHADTVAPFIEDAGPRVTAAWVPGGHVGFPRVELPGTDVAGDASADVGRAVDLEAAVLRWLDAASQRRDVTSTQ